MAGEIAVTFQYQAAAAGVNSLYYEFGQTLTRLLGVVVGRDPTASESKLVDAKVELLDRKTGGNSSVNLGEGNGINVCYIPCTIDAIAPQALKITVSIADLSDNLWFRVISIKAGKVGWDE
jgi:hypothetical protein